MPVNQQHAGCVKRAHPNEKGRLCRTPGVSLQCALLSGTRHSAATGEVPITYQGQASGKGSLIDASAEAREPPGASLPSPPGLPSLLSHLPHHQPVSLFISLPFLPSQNFLVFLTAGKWTLPFRLSPGYVHESFPSFAAWPLKPQRLIQDPSFLTICGWVNFSLSSEHIMSGWLKRG